MIDAKNKNKNDSVYFKWVSNKELFFNSGLIVALSVVLVVGWQQRDFGLIHAEEGLGYWLGICGAAMMVLLLTYSVSKRSRWMRQILPIKRWFQFHMSLGILGPLSIIFHSNFHLGSVNSSVAMICMLLVAGSGIIGRYFYTRIHYSLHGNRIQVNDVASDCETLKNEITQFVTTDSEKEYCGVLFKNIDEVLGSALRYKGIRQWLKQRKNIKSILAKLHLFLESVDVGRNRGVLKGEIKHTYENLKNTEKVMTAILSKVVGLGIFEKLFSLWHIIHIPIFLIMIGSAVVHIVVVHMY